MKKINFGKTIGKTLLPLICSILCVTWAIKMPIGVIGLDCIVVGIFYVMDVFNGLRNLYKL